MPKDNVSWDARLARLAETPDDDIAHKIAACDAAEWHTCAVGYEIGLGENEMPEDLWLTGAGEEFSVAVRARNYERAQRILKAIQERARSGNADLGPRKWY